MLPRFQANVAGMDVREALLRAAIKVFAETGTRGATTRRIAQEANVNEVTLFRHFKSKDDLLREALQFFAAQATTRSLPDEPVDPRAELVQWCRVHHRELYKVRALIRRSMGELDEYPENCLQCMQASIRIADDLAGYLTRLKQNGFASGGWNERAAAAMLLGAVFTDAMGRDTMPQRYPFTMRDAVEQYVDLLLNAIGAVRTAAAGVGSVARNQDRFHDE
jgi:AcrR family transcriptional regulator